MFWSFHERLHIVIENVSPLKVPKNGVITTRMIQKYFFPHTITLTICELMAQMWGSTRVLSGKSLSTKSQSVKIALNWMNHSLMPIMPCGCSEPKWWKQQKRKEEYFWKVRLAGSRSPLWLGSTAVAAAADSRWNSRDWCVHLTLASSGTKRISTWALKIPPFQTRRRGGKIRWVEIALQNGEPFIFHHCLPAIRRVCGDAALACSHARRWNIDIHMEMLPFINIMAKTNWGDLIRVQGRRRQGTFGKRGNQQLRASAWCLLTSPAKPLEVCFVDMTANNPKMQT